MKKILILTMVLVLVAALLTACIVPKTATTDQNAAAQTAMDDKDTETETETPTETPMTDENKNSMIVYDFDGNPVELVGQRTYLKAWASWCSYCIAGMPELEELFAQAHDFKLVTIVAPDFNGELSEEDFKAWFAERGYKIEVYFDRDGVLMNSLGVRGYPSSFYLDETGYVFNARIGHNENDYIKETMAE